MQQCNRQIFARYPKFRLLGQVLLCNKQFLMHNIQKVIFAFCNYATGKLRCNSARGCIFEFDLSYTRYASAWSWSKGWLKLKNCKTHYGRKRLQFSSKYLQVSGSQSSLGSLNWSKLVITSHFQHATLEFHSWLFTLDLSVLTCYLTCFSQFVTLDLPFLTCHS